MCFNNNNNNNDFKSLMYGTILAIHFRLLSLLLLKLSLIFYHCQIHYQN